ncbi:hypothetical protein Tco_0893516 [Tanacetum coccineum]|uniref:RNA-directed DNA polymerase, eukaryota n=1 Tax=Tanacetum coccineum TaxID=301880 RepID=A0ABQ5CEE8_9ASTR
MSCRSTSEYAFVLQPLLVSSDNVKVSNVSIHYVTEDLCLIVEHGLIVVYFIKPNDGTSLFEFCDPNDETRGERYVVQALAYSNYSDYAYCIFFVQTNPYKGDAGQGLSFENVREGRPTTRFCLANLLMFLKLRWDSLLCQSQFTLLDVLAKKQALLSLFGFIGLVISNPWSSIVVNGSFVIVKGFMGNTTIYVTSGVVYTLIRVVVIEPTKLARCEGFRDLKRLSRRGGLSDVNLLFDEELEDIECKVSYDFNLDESTFLVTPLSDSNEDEFFTPRDDIELLLHHDPSISIASILEGFIDEPPLEENDDLFDLESKKGLERNFCKRVENGAKTGIIGLNLVKFNYFSKPRQSREKSPSMPLERARKNESNDALESYWTSSIRGGIEQSQFKKLTDLLIPIVLNPCPDRWFWSLEGSGEFSVASIRRFIDDQRLLTVDSKTLWIKSVPIKVNILAWKIKLEALPTRFNISRRDKLRAKFVLGGISNIRTLTPSLNGSTGWPLYVFSLKLR